MTDDRTVAFLVAGVQKGGTTALFDYLKGHSDLSMAPDKEVHFFDDESVDWSRPDYAVYEARIPDQAGRLKGEATPIYTYWPNSLERIQAYNAAMKLIVVFRDPVERAWSHWRMERARGAEDQPFAVCIRKGRERVSSNGHPNGHHRVHSYVERGFYGAQLERLFALFPREQVFMGTALALRAEPALFLRNVCDFLEIPHFRDVAPKESHVGRTDGEFQSIKAEDEQYLRELYDQDQSLFQQLSGLEL